MLYISKIDDYYLEVLTDKKLKDFVAVNFNEYYKSIGEKKCLRKVAKSLYIFLTTTNELEKYEQAITLRF